MKKKTDGILAVMAVACAAAGFSPTAAGAGSQGDQGDAADRGVARFDVTVARPNSISLQPEIQGYGRVLDPGPLVAALADVEAARAGLNASEKEEARVRKLHDQGGNASAQTLEAAEAALQRDRVQLSAAQGRLVTGWGRELATRFRLDGLLNDLSAGGIAFVRIDLTSDARVPDVPTGARVSALAGGGGMHPVDVIGPAPNADPSLQGPAYLAVWRNPSLPAGSMLRSVLTLPGGARDALVVPRSALVRHEGTTFVYLKEAGDSYERRIVTLGPPVEGGLVVEDGLKPDDEVVVAGAQQLLATEILRSGEVDEDKD